MALSDMTIMSENTSPNPSTETIHFPTGMVGYPMWHRFTFSEEPDMPGIYVLQSLDDPSVSFFLVSTLEVESSFLVSLAHDDAAMLAAFGINEDPETGLYSTLNVDSSGEITANLLGPIVIDHRRGIGVQTVLTSSPWSTRHIIVPATG